jgi:hypothetical protein
MSKTIWKYELNYLEVTKVYFGRLLILIRWQYTKNLKRLSKHSLMSGNGRRKYVKV